MSSQPAMLTRAFLDEQRCGDPTCLKPRGCALFLSGECHAGAPVDVALSRRAVALACAACSAPIGVVAVERYAGGQDPSRIRHRCHPGAPADAVYENGTLTIRCGQCAAAILEAEVTP